MTTKVRSWTDDGDVSVDKSRCHNDERQNAEDLFQKAKRKRQQARRRRRRSKRQQRF